MAGGPEGAEPRSPHVPLRRCVACRRVAPQHELARLAVVEGDRVVEDPGRRLPGRGAYVCSAACHAEAVRRRAYHRAFRRAVASVPDVLEYPPD